MLITVLFIHIQPKDILQVKIVKKKKEAYRLVGEGQRLRTSEKLIINFNIFF